MKQETFNVLSFLKKNRIKANRELESDGRTITIEAVRNKYFGVEIQILLFTFWQMQYRFLHKKEF